MIEKDLVCSKKHNQPIQQVLINHQFPASQRLLCASCITELEEQFVSISFKSAKNQIQQKQEKLSEILSQLTKNTQDQLNQFKQNVEILKSNIIQKFENLIKNSEEWAINLAEFQKSKSQYSLLDEIERFDETITYQEEKLIFEFNEFNFSYYEKFKTIFKIDDMFQNIVETKQEIESLNNEPKVQVYQKPQSAIKIKKYDDNSTPYIPQNCKIHSKEIIQVDLRKGIKAEDRLKCVYCQNEKAVTIVKFAELWNQYNNERKKRINKKQDEQKKRLNDLRDGLYRFIVDLGTIIRQTIQDLENKCFQSETDIDSSELSTIAETLSQDEQSAKDKSDEEKQNTYEEGFSKFDKFTTYLNQAFEQFQFHRLASTNNREEEISIVKLMPKNEQIKNIVY